MPRKMEATTAAFRSYRVKALVVRAGALGDLLLLRRAVAALRRAGHEVVLLAPEHPAQALLGRGPADVQAIIPWDRPDVRALWVAGAADDGRLRGELAGCGRAVAYTRDRDVVNGLRSLVPGLVDHDPQPPASVHAAAWLCEPLRRLGVPWPDAVPTQEADERESGAADRVVAQLPDAFLAIHPGSGSAAKNWPAGRFADLVRERSPERRWLLVRGPADHESAASLAGLPGAVLADSLPSRVLGAVLSKAGLYVGNDSGVTHLAAAWGAPSVALFGPTDPEQWAPLGTRVRVVRSPSSRMDALSLSDVLAAT
jgi:heptosyltransferase III